MKGYAFSVLQTIGRSFMLPIAVLPMAGIFLGIGGAFTSPALIETYHLSFLDQGTLLNGFLILLLQAGLLVFGNLPLLFAIGVAIGMAKTSKETAALSAVLGFLLFHTIIGVLLSYQGLTAASTTPESLVAQGVAKNTAFGIASLYTKELGIFTLQTGILGGILVGLLAAFITNRFSQKKLPDYLAFFSGNRLVAVVTMLLFIPLGAVFPYIWPPIFKSIVFAGEAFAKMGYIGTFFYGFLMRLLNVFGLHHAIYPLFWYTELGGLQEVGGHMVAGGQRIFFAQLADPAVRHFNVEATRTMTGGFLPMMFGLPAAALAMYHCSDKENRTQVKGILLSAALTSFLTGITEPIEFTFLFVAPVLYVIHALLEGLAYMLMHMLNVAVGITFSRGFIDFTFFGLLQGAAKTSYPWILILGPLYALGYYFIFRLLIPLLDIKTPGRSGGASRLYGRADFEAKEDTPLLGGIVAALGGVENIASLDACITRLRVSVKNPLHVREQRHWTEALKAQGFFISGNGVQIVYGTLADVYKTKLRSLYPELN